MSLIRYTAHDVKCFMVEAAKVPKVPKCPAAPMKPKLSPKLQLLQSRWQARAVVRNLLPALNNPHDPLYWDAVDSAESLLVRQ